MFYFIMLSKRLIDISNKQEVSLEDFTQTKKDVQTMRKLAKLYLFESNEPLDSMDYTNLGDICYFLCHNVLDRKFSRQERAIQSKIILNGIKTDNTMLFKTLQTLLSTVHI